MANSQYKVVIPTNPEKLLKLAEKVRNKHNLDGATSPLAAMSDYNWTDTSHDLDAALLLQTQIEEIRKESEKLTKDRDVLIANVKPSVTGSRDVLLGANKKNPKKLGDWGYEVNASTPKKGGTAADNAAGQ